jgi:putative membrane protein
MMWGWDGTGWFWGLWFLHGAWSLLWLILIIVAIVAIVRALNRHGHGSSALALLQERYAKGEIDRNEYLQKKQDLGG